MQAGVSDSGAQVGIYDAGLDDSALIFDVNFQDAIHSRERDDDAALACERATGKARAGTAADNGSLETIGELDDFDDVSRGLRKYYALRPGDFNGAVIFVEQQLFGPAEDSVAAKKMLQFAEEAVFHGRLDARMSL